MTTTMDLLYTAEILSINPNCRNQMLHASTQSLYIKDTVPQNGPEPFPSMSLPFIIHHHRAYFS
jgi:hypothetical protein